MLKKNSYSWSDSARAAFNALKTAVTQAPILALPNFSKQFTIECNASGHGHLEMATLFVRAFVCGEDRSAKLEVFAGAKDWHPL